MDTSPVIAISVVVALFVLSIAFRRFDLHIKIKDLLDVELTATRRKEETEPDPEAVVPHSKV